MDEASKKLKLRENHYMEIEGKLQKNRYKKDKSNIPSYHDVIFLQNVFDKDLLTNVSLVF